MGRLGLAFRAFFRTLSDQRVADGVERLLSGDAAPVVATPPIAAPSVQPAVAPKSQVSATAARSEALNLLEALQREARLVDFLKEPIAAYSDAQIGAAVRDVHRGAAAVLDRVFALKPVLADPEGASVNVPSDAAGSRIRLLGNVAGQQSFRGTLRHAGWEAAKVELPEWSGPDSANRVVAPAEVEIA